jgi:hypothetical protein
MWIRIFELKGSSRRSRVLPQVEPSVQPDDNLVESVVELLKLLSKILSLNFWNSLQYLSELPAHLIPESGTLRSRREMVHAHILQLRSRSVNTADVSVALHFAFEVTNRLKTEFSLGTISEDQPMDDDARYFCAALIPALAQQFEEVWPPGIED